MTPATQKNLERRAVFTDAHGEAFAKEVIDAFDKVNGLHPGFRPAHAKGILLTGTFKPSPDAGSITNAPHILRDATPVSVRFSDFGGSPTIADGDPNASPRGMAIRFHLAEHAHTDIVAHSVDGFPARTGEEFLEFLEAIAASSQSNDKPLPIERFLGAHPAALKFIQTPKPTPVSFAKENFFAVSAFRFINEQGEARYGRYRIRPEGGSEYLDSGASKTPNFLFEEIEKRIATAPPKLQVSVQLANQGDPVDDSTVSWPNDRPEIAFGEIALTGVVPDNAEEQRHIIFDPIPRVTGIEPSADPLLSLRADVYLMSGRRRRTSA